jgi:hypothetical protein
MSRQIFEQNIESLNDYNTYVKDQNGYEAAAAAFAETEQPIETQQQPIIDKQPDVPQIPKEGLFKRFVKDVARGTIGEGGRAIVSGATKGINEMLDIVDDTAQWLNENIVELPQTEKKFTLPQPTFGVDKAESPKSVTGNIIEDITQFLSGFGVAGRAMKGFKAGTKTEKLAKRTGQAALGDVLAFDEQEERLSNIIQDVPALQNPVTEFLQTDENDSVAEAKFKQAIEGVGLGLAGEGLGKAIQVLRKNKKVKQNIEAELEAVEKVPETGLQVEQLSMLGKADSEDFVFTKMQAAVKETEGLTAKQIDELPLIKKAQQAKNIDDFLDSIPPKEETLSGAMQHRPTKTGATASNVTQDVSDMGFPKDFYQNPHYYEDMTDKSVKESFRELLKVKGDPNAEVTIYRASPIKELRTGDWVTLSKEYAKDESLQEGVEVYSFKARAKDIQFAGDSINEFGYFGHSTKERLRLADIFNKAKSEKAAPKFQTADDIQINFARINGPEDLKQAMQAYANETQLLPKVQDARRGVRSNEVTLREAEDIDGFQTLLERREGQPLNAEQITAARNFYYNTTNKLMELAKKAASPEATDVDQYAFRKMVATHHAVQKEVLGARAEAGRALQAWSIPATGTPTEKLKGMEEILNIYGGAEAGKDLAKKLASFADGQLDTTQINYITQNSAYARTKDALVEVWTAGLLTNPTTHSKNILSNTATTLMLGFERYGQALLPQSNVTIAEANAYFKGLVESQKLAFANAGKAFKTGQVTIGMERVELPRVRASSRDILDLQGMAKPLGYALDYYGRVVNTSFKALAAGDEYSKTVLYKAQLNALATREGITKGFKGEELRNHIADSISSPSQLLQQQAIDFADYATYTNQLGKTGQQIQRILSTNPSLKFVVPFFKTPTNIFKFTYERTPLALTLQKTRKDLAAGGDRQAEALVKIGMGSSLMALGVDMSINGNITGAGPSNPKTRAALKRTGWQPNSIKIGDTYYSYAGLEPFSTLFSFSTTMAEVLTNYEMYDIEAQDEVDKVTTASILALTDATINKTFLQGISNLMDAFSDPERKAESFVQRFLSSFVPAGVAAGERAVNPEREYVTNITDAFKARIPGFSEDLPKRRNVYGEVIQYRYPDENILDQTTSGVISLFNPFYASKEKDSPLDEYLLKEGYSVSMPLKTQTFDGERINLRDYPESYSRMLELRGQETKLIQYNYQNMKDALTSLIDRKLPQSFIFHSSFTDGEEKQDIINKIQRDYMKAAKEKLREEYPIIDQLVLQAKLEKQNNEAL